MGVELLLPACMNPKTSGLKYILSLSHIYCCGLVKGMGVGCVCVGRGEEDGGRVTFTCLYESKDFGFEIHGWVNLHEHRRQGLKQQQRTLMIKMR